MAFVLGYYVPDFNILYYIYYIIFVHILQDAHQ